MFLDFLTKDNSGWVSLDKVILFRYFNQLNYNLTQKTKLKLWISLLGQHLHFLRLRRVKFIAVVSMIAISWVYKK